MKKSIGLLVAFLAGGTTHYLANNALVEYFTPPPFRSMALTEVPKNLALTAYEKELLDDPIKQSDSAICGAASIEAVLRTFGVVKNQEIILNETNVIDGEKVYYAGMTLDEMALLMEEQGTYSAEVLRPKSLPELREALSNLSDERYRAVANYSRVPLTGENIGHHTPILAYDPESDTAVLQDVTDGYGNYQLPLAVILTAMMTPDSDTGLQRGIMLVSIDE